jgi:hypothetical protein
MKHLLLFSIFGILSGLATSAQTLNNPTPVTNTDSLKLVVRINENRLKMGKLQNTVDQQRKDKINAADKSQESADKNTASAEKLSANPTDRKMANNADNSAGDAKRDSKRARKESDKLDKLNKDIMDLKGKIATDQAKLSVYTNVVAMAPVMGPMPVDTTMHP